MAFAFTTKKAPSKAPAQSRRPFSVSTTNPEAVRAFLQATSHGATDGGAASTCEAPNPIDTEIDGLLASSPGRELTPPTQRSLAPSVDTDLTAVRVHDDPDAHRLNRALGARATTFGESIFFAGGQFAPNTGAGRRLLLHELGHVAQQTRVGGIGPRLQRAPAQAGRVDATSEVPEVVTSSPDSSSKPSDGERIAPLVENPDLIDKLSPKQIADHGMWLASTLLAHGHVDLGRRMLGRMTGNEVTQVWQTDIGAKLGSVDPKVAQDLIDQAIRAALDREHGFAMELLATVYNVTQIALFQASATITSSPMAGQAELDVWQEMLKQIFAIYPALIRQNMRTGDKDSEKEYKREWEKIKADLFVRHTISETPMGRQIPNMPPLPRGPNDIDPIVIGTAEVTKYQKKALSTGEVINERVQFDMRGTGVGSSTKSVKPVTQEHASLQAPTLTDSMRHIAADVAGQQDFVTKLYGYETIRKEFPDGPPNLRDREERIRVWAAIYDADEVPRAIALRGTMQMIAEYLALYTLHSSWDIADSGKTYLSQEMPTDLAGRLLLDCGVYALSVATELFAAVKRSGKGTLEAEIYIVPAHVVLILLHESTDEFYMVNNDTIQGPAKIPRNIQGVDDPLLGMVATAFSGVVGQGNDPVTDIVAPYGRVKMGSTAEHTEEDFNKRYWDRYQTVSQGYSALANADYSRNPEDYDKYNAVEKYRKDMGDYRDLSAQLHKELIEKYVSVITETDDATVRAAEQQLLSDKANLFGLADELLAIFVPYGPSSAQPGLLGDAVAPRGGRSKQARAAEAILEPKLQPGKADPYLFHTELQLGDVYMHPLVLFKKVLQRMLSARGAKPDCINSADPVANAACVLIQLFD